MNAKSTQQKKIGDRVKITGGQHRDQIGILAGKESRAWMVELEDGSQVTVAFPMVVLIETSQVEDAGNQTAEATASAETSTEEAGNESTAQDATQVTDDVQAEADNSPDVEAELAVEGGTSRGTDAADPEAGANEDETSTNETDSTGVSLEIAAMTVRELWALAKQRGVSVARTKSDFFRIIKAMNPDEDLAALKGKALFDRVSELHISRLRSKAEMVRLLSQ